MEIFVITYPKDIPNEHELLIYMLKKGVENLHIRKPDYTIEDMYDYLSKIPRKYHSRLILHSHFELSKEFEVKGFHFNQNNIDEYEKYFNIGTTSYSCHSFEEVLKLNNAFKYVFLSPIFDSISKKGYLTSFSKHSIRQFLFENEFSSNIVALGGIDDSNIEEIHYLGFDGAAILGSVWEGFYKDNDLEKAKIVFDKIFTQVQISNTFFIQGNTEFGLN